VIQKNKQTSGVLREEKSPLVTK